MRRISRSAWFLACMLAGCLALASCGGEDGGTAADGADSGPDTGGDPGGNRGPQISGSPSSSAVQGQTYAFVPSASDADGDALTFSVTNRPSWAEFNPATGRILGTPDQGDLGMYSNIRISVTDGTATASLAPFSIEVLAMGTRSVTLSWLPPTEKEDGSPLTDLAGYNIYWGTSPDYYFNSETVDAPGITSYVVQNLAPNTYYFVTTAFDTMGIESGFSNRASTTVQ